MFMFLNKRKCSICRKTIRFERNQHSATITSDKKVVGKVVLCKKCRKEIKKW